ncbi:MAG: nucleotidyltransferase family protein [Phycisphaerae bacterium]
MFTTCILLAAGAASRMKTDKLSLPYKGQRLFDCALAPFVDSPLIDEIIVVVNPGFRLPVEASKCRAVVNADYLDGLGASLRTGVAAAASEADIFLVALADMPELTEEILTTIIEAFRRSDKQILVPVYQQRNGHPVVFAQSCKEKLLKLEGDVGARTLIRDHPELVEYFPTEHRAVVFDIDTPEDIELGRKSED